MATKFTTDADLLSIANAIRTKGGTSEGLEYPSGFVSAIQNIPTGGGGGSSDDVRYIDYDGTIIETYSASEFASLTAHPSNPSHTGLTAQGWNWSLTDAKAYVADMGKLDIGQTYITDDNKTHIYVTLTEERKSPIVGLNLYGTAIVDWGDNTPTETLSATSITSTTWTNPHEYASAGSYVITIAITDGRAQVKGTTENSGGSSLLRASNTSTNYNYFYRYAVTKIEFGSGIESIESYGLAYSYSLQTITIPYGTDVYSSGTFYRCFSLQCVVLPVGSIDLLGTNFIECSSLRRISIPKNIASFNSSMFKDCFQLERIALPITITDLKPSIFSGCRSLTEIKVPYGYTAIGDNCFEKCFSLEKVSIPETVTSFGSYAFSLCYSMIDDYYIPATIGESVFQYHDRMTHITLPDGIKAIPASTFQNCSALKSVTFANDVTSIGNSAFAYCYGLESISFPDTLTSIGQYAFQYCRTLQNIDIPSGVTQIQSYTFQYCDSLQKIMLPDTITNIGTYAFRYCYSVKELHIAATTPPTLGGTNAFLFTNNYKIYVPYSADHSILDAYKAATNWSSLSYYIYEEPEP